MSAFCSARGLSRSALTYSTFGLDRSRRVKLSSGAK